MSSRCSSRLCLTRRSTPRAWVSSGRKRPWVPRRPQRWSACADRARRLRGSEVGRRMRILIVEDSAKMAGLLKKGLDRQGYAVDAVTDGQDAVWMATENDYDAIVLDVILDARGPAIDGFEVCRRLRTARRWAPVLMVTARDAVADRVHGLDAGADDYLTKPFSLDELLARLRAVLRRHAARSEEHT